MTWISCKDRLPDKGKSVLCFSGNRIFHAWWDDISSTCDWYDIRNCWIIENVSHWMPLPDPPHPFDEILQKEYDDMVNSMWRPTPQKIEAE